MKYNNLYPGIDLVHFGDKGQLEHDFIVAPGADPNAISFSIEGDERIKFDAQGNLLLDEGGKLLLQRPRIYQECGGVRAEISGSYVLRNNRQVGFLVKEYDARLPLVIDPVLSYSTYLGGTAEEQPAGIAVDLSGNVYTTGATLSADFPTALPFQAKKSGGSDAFVTKLNSSGNALIYSTYLGGSSDDATVGIAMDSSGNVYISGMTTSTNLPTASPLQANYGGGQGDAFVTKLNSSGNAFVYSTYLGGISDDGAIGIAVDSSANVYITGITASPNFPTANPFQANPPGDYDAFVAKIVDFRPTLEIALSGGGAGSQSTASIGSWTQVGYAAATVASGTSPYGVAVFSFKQNGVVVSEAAVPASPPTTSARIFVDYRSAVPAIPGRSDAGSVEINTGLAIVNRGAAAANVTYTPEYNWHACYDRSWKSCRGALR